MKKRRSLDSFNLPITDIKAGFYSDIYFSRTKEILAKEHYNPTVVMQVFQRNDATLCGIDEAIAIIKNCADNSHQLKIKALHDGDDIAPWETVMLIEGKLADFVHLETVYLGVLARQTKVATNVKNSLKAAKGKPVIFFPSRFDHYTVQQSDGYAAHIGGIDSVSTPANAFYWQGNVVGTIPHALIAAYHGDTLRATLAFAENIDSAVKVVALVDFHNDCVNTALEIATALKDKLFAVRLDTSDKVVDKSLWTELGTFVPTGVNPFLVQKVRSALDNAGFNHVKIMVSGGFNAEKIKQFEADKVAVDIYAIGSSIFKNNIDYTADIVMVDNKPSAKFGRKYNENPRLSEV